MSSLVCVLLGLQGAPWWYCNTPSIVSKTLIFVRGSWEPIRMVKLSFLFREFLQGVLVTLKPRFTFFAEVTCGVRSRRVYKRRLSARRWSHGWYAPNPFSNLLPVYCVLYVKTGTSEQNRCAACRKQTIRKDCWLWKQHIGSNTREHTWCIVRSRN